MPVPSMSYFMSYFITDPVLRCLKRAASVKTFPKGPEYQYSRKSGFYSRSCDNGLGKNPPYRCLLPFGFGSTFTIGLGRKQGEEALCSAAMQILNSLSLPLRLRGLAII